MLEWPPALALVGILMGILVSEDLVVKITGLVVIVKEWILKRRMSLIKRLLAAAKSTNPVFYHDA